MRDSLVFYRSFYESVAELSDDDRLKVYDALFKYALDGEEPSLSGAPLAIFKLMRPQVDANNRKYENGKKGGRPKANDNHNKTKAKPNNNQSKAKPKPNVNVNVNDNVNDNDNDNDNGLGSSGRGRYQCDDDFNIWKRLTPEDIDVLYEKFPNSGGLLIDAVYEDVKSKRTKVKSGLKYILGYAKNVGWDDNADHFDGGGLS